MLQSERLRIAIAVWFNIMSGIASREILTPNLFRSYRAMKKEPVTSSSGEQPVQQGGPLRLLLLHNEHDILAVRIWSSKLWTAVSE
jgi:hypothetical protein